MGPQASVKVFRDGDVTVEFFWGYLLGYGI